jgi:hypothetical protein
MADWKEGDVVTNPDTGQELTLTGGQWVPTGAQAPTSALSDAAKATLPALERTGMAVATLPNTAGKLAAQGINAAGDYAFPDWKSSPPGKVMSAAENYFGNKDYTAAQKKVEDAAGPLYTAQTPGGKIWEGAVGAAPMGAIGEGAMIPNMVRALASGGASEAAGQATQGTSWELPARLAAGVATYGATGALQPARITANTPRAAAAQTLENAGVPVSGADITGSRLMSTLEGQPPAGQTNAVSNAMKQQGGIVRPPGNTDQFSRLVEQRGRDLGTEADRLGAATSVPATPQLRQQLANSVAQHVGNYGGTSLERPEVSQALQDYDQLTTGGAPLTGTAYQGLTRQWNASGVPELRTMATTLDRAMDTAHPGVWDQWRQNYADYSGLKAASDALGGEATTKPLSPDQVVSTMHRRTPMRDTAEAAQTIQGARPQPYDFSTISKIGHVIGALGGVGGAYHGGSEQALAGAIVPEIVGQGLPAAISLTQPLFRSGAGQNFMRNLDPRVVSALLAQQGVRPKGTAAEEPQGAAQ